jgi:hypothetical protein
MNIPELEKLAKAASDGRSLAKLVTTTPQTTLVMIELIKEMGEVLEDVAYDEEGYIMNPDAAEVHDKYMDALVKDAEHE